MIVLNGQTLTPARHFVPETESLTLTERGSTATVTLPDEEAEIKVGTWLLEDTEPGKGTVWRVKTAEEQYDTGTRTLTLEHIIHSLEDDVTDADLDPKAMGGTDSGVSATAAIRKILSYQSIWTLGGCDYDVIQPYSFNRDTIWEALETVCSALEDAVWEYDLSRVPFRLYIRRAPSTPTCEMRRGRNLTTLSVTVDRNGLMTRIYPIGQNNLQLPEKYLSRNEATWGRVSRVETDQSLTTEDALRAWAKDRLRRHCTPKITVQISGLELSESTGEALDQLTLGAVCRVPLPEYGTTVSERIVKLSWRDKIRDQESVSVTLANELTDVQTILKQERTRSGRGGRAGAKKDEEDHAWFVDTTDHVAMVAETIVGRTDGTIDWSRVSSIIVDGEGIHQRVQRAEGDLVNAWTAIEQNETAISLEAAERGRQDELLSGRITVEAGRITAEVTRATTAEGLLSGRIDVEAGRITAEVQHRIDGDSDLSGRITIEAGRITQEVTDRVNGDEALSGRITIEAGRITQEVTDRTSADRTLSGRIDVEAGKITQIVQAVGDDGEVTAASIVLAINSTTGESEVHIDAGHVYIGNTKSTTVIAGKLNASEFTAESIGAKIATLGTLTTNAITANGSVAFNGSCLVKSGTDAHGNTYINLSNNVHKAIKGLQIVQNGNTYTLQAYRLGASDSSPTWEDIGTFSRAVTSIGYAWSQGRLTVTAQPQGYSTQLLGVAAAGSWDSTNPNTYNGRIRYYEGSDDETLYNTGATFTVNAQSRYNNGWHAAADELGWPEANTSSDTMTIAHPAYNVGTTSSHAYTVSADNDYAYIKNAVATVVARVANPAYQNGWNAARNAETRVTMTRGAYSEQSRTYTCTCTLSAALAPSATFYLWAR